MREGYKLTRCDACYYADGDEGLKETRYCNLCSSNICDSCRPNWWKRMKAAFERGSKQEGE